MTGEVVNQREGPAIRAVEAQQANLRVHGADAGHVLVAGRRVGAAEVQLAAVLQLEPAVFLDALLAPAPRAGAHGHHVLHRLLHRLHGERVGVRAHDAVAMAGVDEHARRRDAQLPLQLRAHLAEVIIPNPPDAADGHRVHRDEHDGGGAVLEHQRLHVGRVVDRPRRAVRDVHLRDASEELGGCGIADERHKGKRQHGNQTRAGWA